MNLPETFPNNLEVLRQTQNNNLSLVERGRELAKSFSETDIGVIDIFEPSTISYLTQQVKIDLFEDSANQDALRKEMLSEIKDKYNCKVEFLETPELVVATKRTNLKEFPIPWQEYPITPYIYNFDSLNEPYLDNGVAVHINTPAQVLAKTSSTFKDSDGVEHIEQFLYVATNTVRGWVVAKDFINKKQEDLLDPLRPLDNVIKVEERGNRLGIIMKHGLKIENNKLVPVNKYTGNARFQGDITDYEGMGDGMLETGESALASIGNVIEIINETEADYTVLLPNGIKFFVDKSYINIGYLEPTVENMERLIGEVLDSPYSWGDKDGLGFDCSGLTSTLLAASGIVTARGGIGQMNGLLEQEFAIASRKDENEDFINFLPQTLADLSQSGFDVTKIKWGYTTASWGFHVMLMTGVDEDGNISYVHAVGPQKKILKENINNANAEKRVTTERKYRVVKSNANEFDSDGNLLTYSPYLANEDPKLNQIKLVVHI